MWLASITARWKYMTEGSLLILQVQRKTEDRTAYHRRLNITLRRVSIRGESLASSIVRLYTAKNLFWYHEWQLPQVLCQPIETQPKWRRWNWKRINQPLLITKRGAPKPVSNLPETMRRFKKANREWVGMLRLHSKSTVGTLKWCSLMAVKRLVRKINSLLKNALALEKRPLPLQNCQDKKNQNWKSWKKSREK